MEIEKHGGATEHLDIMGLSHVAEKKRDRGRWTYVHTPFPSYRVWYVRRWLVHYRS